VWLDADKDGIQDAGEIGMQGVQVKLFDNSGQIVGITTTDINGFYQFANLTPGTYSVNFSNLPDGYKFTTQTNNTATGSDADTITGNTPSFTLTSGQNKTDIDAGLKTSTKAALGNYVWFDANSNGLQDVSEIGIPGVLVTLLDKVGNALANTVTDANGYYLFDNLKPGTYIVWFTNLPNGSLFTTKEAVPAANGSDVSGNTGKTAGIVLAAGTVNLDIDAGIKPGVPGSVGNYVWNDLNKDGLQNANEKGVPGVIVTLKDAAGIIVGTTVTSGNGYYNFANVIPAPDYTVEFSNLPTGFLFTTPSGTILDSLNSDANTTTGATAPFTVGNGQYVNTIDAGLIKVETIGDRVWFDRNHNGIQDSITNVFGVKTGPEMPVAGVIVYLKNSVTNAIIATDTTDATGYYLFSGSFPGSYYIQVAPSSFPDTAFHVTRKDQGTNDNIDSDVDSITFKSNVFSVPALANDLTHDIGLVARGIPNLGDPCSCFDVEYDPGEHFQVIDQLILEAFPGDTWIISSQNGMFVLDTFLYTPVTIPTLLHEDSAGHYSYTFAHDVGIGYNVVVTNGVDTLTYGNVCYQAETALSTLPDSLCLYDAPVALSASAFKTVGGVQVNASGTFVFTYVKSNGDTVHNATQLNPLDFTPNSKVGISFVFTPTDPVDCPRHMVDSLFIYQGNCASYLGNYVWNDINKNGIQEASEPGIAGVAVTLIDQATNKVVGATVTDAFGKYLFTSVPGGTYKVGFTPPANYIFTQNIDPSGTDVLNTLTNSDVDTLTNKTAAFVFPAGTQNLNADAGMYFEAPISATIGNYVWEDANSNGIQDPTESGIAGVLVTLFNNAGTPIAYTTTDATGNYLFKDVVPGSYTVGFSSPIGYLPTLNSGPVSNPSNSDLVASTGKTAPFTVNAGDKILTIDAGFVPQAATKASLGDKVWYDNNQDGIQDANETGIANVTVQLYNSAGTTLLSTTTTDAKGNYVFNNLAAGAYKVLFTAPSGFTISSAVQGTDTAKDSNPNISTGFSNTINLTSGQKNMSIDAGMYNPANTNSIGDKVWLDNNSNGIQDASEPGATGVTVTLYNNAGTPIATTVTDAKGFYNFPGLPNGTYKVGFSNLPNGYLLTNQTTGTIDGSDPDPATGKTPSITLTGGQDITDMDAGLKPSNIPSGTASLGDKVWWDVNSNGLQDAGETGVQNVTVFLYASDGITILDSISTDAQGKYMFTGLAAGSYIVGFDLNTIPAGTTVTPFNVDAAGIYGTRNSDANTTSGNSPIITIAVGEDIVTVDMGIIPATGSGSIGDKVWLDANKDGLQTAGEPGVPGVQVILYDGVGKVVATTTTDANGLYLFPNLPAGTYSVGFSNLPTGYNLTHQTTGTPTGSDPDSTTGFTPPFTLAGGQIKNDVDAGIVSNSKAALGNYVWFDTNGDGLQTPGEPGVAGVTVNLLDTLGNIIATTVTDGDGGYLFINLNPNTYVVEFTNLSSGTAFTTKEGAPASNGSDAAANGKTNAILLTAGQVNLDIDAGLIASPKASVGDFVWIDANKNGLQGTNEPGIAGVKVVLKDINNNVVGTAITDGSGKYKFDNVVPGTGYTVQFVKPVGYTITTKSGLVLDSLNSDPVATTGITTAFAVSAGQYVNTIDAGMFKSGIILSGHVWIDTNANTDNYVNETHRVGATIPTGLRVYLVDPLTNLIIDQKTVPSFTGTFTFTNFVNPSTNYYLILSSTAALNGTTVPQAKVPGWENTGEKLGITTGSDLIPNGRINIPGSLVDIINANFGIRPKNGESVIP
jgi:protocatechuate 3,4-dioxygenase beta subunit